ncbi:MAG: rRNA maturation RNase YbeY [bacterium]|nr:rRNA maturation RNase YbeY [bacterium]
MRLLIHKEIVTRVPQRAMRELFAVVSGHEAKKNWQAGINLIFTTDRRIQQLNDEYRGKDKPTDVLSFNIDDPASKDATFGEIYISVPTASRQAASLGHSLELEYLRLTCHGLMHLFGYDHQEYREAERMEARERKYLRAIGRIVK